MADEMQPQFAEIESLEPEVVDLTINHDAPEFSVRMPIYKLNLTHRTDFLELRFKLWNGDIVYSMNLSDGLLGRLANRADGNIVDAKELP